MTFLIPFNYFLSTAFTTPAQKVQAGFYTLIVVESQIVFLTSFVIVSQYFTLHDPNFRKLVEQHKEENPEIPEEYYQDPKQRQNNKVVTNVIQEIKETNQATDDVKQEIVKQKKEPKKRKTT